MSRARDLFERHHLPVFRYMRKSTGNSARAEDLTQEVFVRMLGALPRYESRGRDAAWIFTIARNVLASGRRSASRRPEPVPVEAGDSARAPGQAVRIDLQTALDALDPLDRDTFLLREAGGLTYDEIAAACEITADAVRSRIYRARRSLRERLTAGPRRIAKNKEPLP